MLGQLEPEYHVPFQAWQSTPTPATNAAMLKALRPTIDGAIQTHVGKPNPLLTSRARIMALDGLRSYDPQRGRLQTHLYNHLQGLKRVNRQQTSILRVPERISLDRYNLDAVTKELEHTLGREPSDAEVADHSGFSLKRIAKVRTYQPAVSEGTIDAATESGGVYGNVASARPPRSNWAEIVYDGLDAYHQKIAEHTLGLHGQRVLSNLALAQKMKRSPGAISQAKLRIQKMLDEENDFAGMI